MSTANILCNVPSVFLLVFSLFCTILIGLFGKKFLAIIPRQLSVYFVFSLWQFDRSSQFFLLYVWILTVFQNSSFLLDFLYAMTFYSTLPKRVGIKLNPRLLIESNSLTLVFIFFTFLHHSALHVSFDEACDFCMWVSMMVICLVEEKCAVSLSSEFYSLWLLEELMIGFGLNLPKNVALLKQAWLRGANLITFLFVFLIPAVSLLNGYYLGALLFFQFKEFELYWGAVFFLSSVHTFSWFLKSNWSSDFSHAENGKGAKKRVVLRSGIFCSVLKVEWENGVWTKICFLARYFLITCGHFFFIFYCFSIFWIRCFFLNGFSISFIVHSMTSFFVWTKISFLAYGFFTCGILTLIFCFFFFAFFINVVPNSLIICSMSSVLLSPWKFFELYVRTCPAMFLIRFTFWSRFSFYISHDFHVWLASLTVSIEWFSNPFTHWIAQDSEYSQGQKRKIKRDGINW